MIVPCDIEAEADILCRVFYDPHGSAQWARDNVPAEAYYKPQHQWLAETLYELTAGGTRVDPVTLRTALESKRYDVDPQLLLFVASVPNVSLAQMRAAGNRVVETWHRRRLLVGCAELVEAARDMRTPITDALSIAQKLRQEVPVSDTEPAPDLDDFLGMEEDPHDWIVPGLLERGDRLILTGSEGLGKSTFTRHLLMAIAHGMHPYSERIIEPRRVLLIDAENSERQLRRALRGLHQNLTEAGYPMPPGAFRLRVTTEQLDLKQPAAQRWLYEQVQANEPDVLYIGPLYQIGAVGNDEDMAAKVQGVLDTVRKRWGPALVLETHSPHGESGARRPIRPIGASIWMRWPEFGYGLVKDREDPNRILFSPWRGARDERDWPRVLEKGGRFMWRTLEPTNWGV